MNQEQFEKLAHDVAKLTAAHEISNLMGRMTYLYEAGMYEEQLAMFARKTPGVTAESSQFGQRQGLEGARAVVVDFWINQYANHAEQMRKLYPEDANETGRNGVMDLQALSSPVIEVADDLKTAKGMWYAPTIATECHPGGDMPTGHHVWLKFAVDFIVEDGEWKIWHYHICPHFNTNFNKSWVESSLEMEKMFAEMPPEMLEKMAPKGPVTAYHAYSVHEPPAYDPKPPVPYKTFSETFPY